MSTSCTVRHVAIQNHWTLPADLLALLASHTLDSRSHNVMGISHINIDGMTVDWQTNLYFFMVNDDTAFMNALTTYHNDNLPGDELFTYSYSGLFG